VSKDQDLIKEIGRHLWDLFPEDAARIEFTGHYYPSGHQAGPIWYDAEGSQLGPKAYTPDLMVVVESISSLIRELRKQPPFAADPFTHIKCVMDGNAKLDMTVAHIPEWDSWPGLFMRGVSDLAEDELSDALVSKDDWRACCQKRKEHPYSP